MPDISSTLAAIDAVVGCHQCGGELGASPSDDFCSEACSRLWKAGRVGVRTDGLGEPILSEVDEVSAHWEHLHPAALFGSSYVVTRGDGPYPELRPVPHVVPVEDLPPLYRITARGDVSQEREDPAIARFNERLRETLRRIWSGVF